MRAGCNRSIMWTGVITPMVISLYELLSSTPVDMISAQDGLPRVVQPGRDGAVITSSTAAGHCNCHSHAERFGASIHLLADVLSV